MPSEYDFSQMHSAMQGYIDKNLLSGISALVLKGTDVVDFKTFGSADIESNSPMQPDTIYRLYSNTKIITAVAAMTLFEEGHFQLDDPIEKYLPQLADRQVLKADAKSVTDTEPSDSQPTVRQIMCHNAGFSYGFLQESKLDELYNAADIMAVDGTLADMIDKLADMPLAYQPGSRWQYSVASDILARLIEIWSGTPFDDFLKTRIFDPLEMVDTGFHLETSKQERIATLYSPKNIMDPSEPGLIKTPDRLVGYDRSNKFFSGGGGLLSTIIDYTEFIRMIVNGGEWNGARILTSETIDMMHTNHLPEGVGVQFPHWLMPDTVFGLGLAIKTRPFKGEPDAAIGEYHWGGMAGTHSWMSPQGDLAGLVFTQRMPGFWHQFSWEFRRLVYQAMT